MGFVNNILNGVQDILESNIKAASPIIVNKGATNDIVAGDINIIDITMSSQDGQRTYSLIEQCKTINIYESIHSPAIFCELFIRDSTRLLQDFPIICEELVTISFETPNNPGNPTKYIFQVNEVMNKVIDENQKTMTYTLQCISPELMVNAVNFVDKDFDDTISNIVKNIMEEKIKTKKKLTVDKTIGVDKYPIFKLEPFKAIHSLLPLSVSDRYKSHAYVFFENKDGFYFTTYEKLIEAGRKQQATGLSDKIFFYDMVRKEKVEDVNIRNIIAYNQVTSSSAISKVRDGAYSGTATTIDMQTAGQRKANYTANIGLDNFQKLDDGGAAQNTTGNLRTFGKSKVPTAFNLLPIFSSKSKNPLTEAFASRQAFLQYITQNITQIHIYGDSEITVGDVIKCRFPSASGSDDDTGLSRLDSGNYLVTHVRHIIINGDRPHHTMALQLVKNDLSETA